MFVLEAFVPRLLAAELPPLSDFLPGPLGPGFPDASDSEPLRTLHSRPGSDAACEMAVLVSALLLLWVDSGLGLEQTCWPVCSGGSGGVCITVNRAGLDFKSAEQACLRRSGELLTLQSETDQRLFDRLPEVLPGSFWIGLHLPAGSCSSLSEPLRGYKWTSGSTIRTFNSSVILWADSLQVCSSRCVSLSQHQLWTERPCSDKPDGFLCRTKDRNACWEQEVFFGGPPGCESAPCEQTCKDTKGGYKCSCFPGYVPDSSEPRRCRPHCPRRECPPVCPAAPQGACFCADGFVKDEETCVDIDECDMDRCDQGCVNTFGSFWCSCRQGFILKSEGKCIPAAGSDDPAELMIPTYKNTTLRASSAPSGAFLWIWVVAALTLMASVFLIRLYVVRRQKRRERPADGPDP